MTAIAPAALAGIIQVEVNGAARQLPAGATVADLLAELRLAAPKVAVERNEEIVPRSGWGSTVLAAGDKLEVVHFIGGG